MNHAKVLADAAAQVAARHREEGEARPADRPAPEPGGSDTGLRFPRHTFGPFKDELPKLDAGWDHHDTPVVDLTESRRRYDAGWVI